MTSADTAARAARPADNLLGRVTRVLEAVVAAGEPVGPRALARETGIDRSAVGRILQQMAALEMLIGDGGRYRPGPRLFNIGRALAAADDLPTAAASILAALVAEYDETSYVCSLQGSSAVFLYDCQSSKPLRYVVELGKPVPLHAGGAGRAILAGLDEKAARQLLEANPLAQLTPSTVTDIDELMDIRAADRERGWSVSRQERVEGGLALGAPFFDQSGLCQGSVVLTAPMARFDNYDGDDIGASVSQAAANLSARLGANNGR